MTTTACPRQPQLLEALLADGMPAALGSHAMTCATCGSTVHRVRRFDAELARAARAVVRSAEAAMDDRERRRGPVPIRRRPRWRWLPALGVAVLLAVAVVVGSNLGRVGQQGGAPLGQPLDREPVVARDVAGLSDQAEVWLADAAAAWDGSNNEPVGELEPVRMTVCGDTSVALFGDLGNETHEYRWAIGRLEEAEVLIGSAQSTSDETLARRQAELAPDCSVVLDRTIAEDAVQAAASRCGCIPAEHLNVLGTTHLAPDLAMAVVEGRVSAMDPPQRWLGPVWHDGNDWWIDPSEWVGTNIPAGAVAVHPFAQMGWNWEDGSLIVATPPPDVDAVAFEVQIVDTVLRYQLEPWDGVVITAPSVSMENRSFRFVDAAGEVVWSGDFAD